MKWRSVLFTPGNRPERVEKGWASGAADVVVADLEDAVPPQDKAMARQAVAKLLEAPRGACRRAVRINGWPSKDARADLESAAKADLIVVPKVESPQQVQDIAVAMAKIRGDFDEPFIVAILETPTGVLDARAIAAAPCVAAVAFGAEDLAASAGMRRTAGNKEIEVPRAMVALAGACQGVAAIDMITADFRDVERTHREASEARNLGYAGKMCLHPLQVTAVHDAFAPTPAEKAWAQKVIAAVDAGGIEEGGVVVVDGRMIDRPLIAQARQILQD